MANVSIYEWIQFLIIFLTIAGIGLAHLKNQTFITKSQAWTNVVNGASNIIAQIEATLKGDSVSTTRDQLIAQGIAELKQVYSDSLAKVKIPASVVDGVLTLLFQRLGSKLPVALQDIVGEVVPAIPGLPSAGVKVSRPRAYGFLRTVGPVA
jgi:hypothetical protein